MPDPKVSIVMPVYNGETYLKEAIDSMLSQSFSDFEFIIINDGSKDRSADIIKSFADSRILFLNNSQNAGIVNALNQGIDASRGEYIVRMDCDDISHPERIIRQIAYMDANKHIGISGSGMRLIRKGNNNSTRSQQKNDTELKITLLFNTCFFHPTVIIRKSVLDSHRYPDNLAYVEDYNFWTYMANNTTFGNIQDNLLNHRIHENQTSTKKNRIQIENSRIIRNSYLKSVFGISEPFNNLIHNSIAENHKKIDLTEAQQWLEYLYTINQQKSVFDNDIFLKELGNKWWRCCKSNIHHNSEALNIYNNSRLSSLYCPPRKQYFKTVIKSIFYHF